MSEIETVGIPTVSSVRVAPPRIAAAAVAFECEVAEIKPYPAENPNCHLIFARVLLAHVDDAVLADERHVIAPGSTWSVAWAAATTAIPATRSA